MSKERAGLFALLGLTGLTLGGIALASASSRKPSSVEIGPVRRIAKDWSGCGKPPEYIREVPRFACQQQVEVYRNNAATARADQGAPNNELNSGPYQVVGRAWGEQPDSMEPAPSNWPGPEKTVPVYRTGKGEWNYDLVDRQGKPAYNGLVPEYWLKPAVSSSPAVVKKVAAVLAPTATPAAAPVVKAQVAPVTVKQEAAMNLPLYPQGLIMSKDNTSGTVLGIKKTPDGSYSYQLRGARGMFSENYTVNEPQLVNKLAELAGQQAYGFAFPVGVTLLMKKLKLQIQGRQVKDGKMFYTTDALGEITEPQLIIKLYEAQKG